MGDYESLPVLCCRKLIRRRNTGNSFYRWVKLWYFTIWRICPFALIVCSNIVVGNTFRTIPYTITLSETVHSNEKDQTAFIQGARAISKTIKRESPVMVTITWSGLITIKNIGTELRRADYYRDVELEKRYCLLCFDFTVPTFQRQSFLL